MFIFQYKMNCIMYEVVDHVRAAIAFHFDEEALEMVL